MNKVTFAVLAAVIAGGALVAPTEASAIVMRFGKGDGLRIGDAAIAKGPRRVCEMRTMWNYDYSGNLYLKKVRVCA